MKSSSAATVNAQVDTCQPTSVDQQALSRSTDVDQALALLRQAVQERGWTLDALAAAMGKDRAYIGKVLNGDKPFTLEFLVALPDDVEARYEHLRAEHFGLIVVQPLEGADAHRAFVAGFLGMVAPRLPARASGMAKAELRDVERRAVSR